MIVAPDWTTLRGVSAGLDSTSPIERKKAVERIVGLIADEVPDVEAVRLYDVDDDIAIVRYATDLQEKSASALSGLPLVNRCLEERRAIWQPEERQWAQPLIAGEYAIGAVEMLVEELDEDWLTWLDVIVTQMARAEAIVRLPEGAPTAEDEKTGVTHRRPNRLVTASRMLLTATEYEDIATAAIYMVGPGITAVTVTIFEQPLSVQGRGVDGIANNRRFVGAIATRAAIRNLAPDEAVSSLPEQSFVANLRQEIPLIIDNVETDARYLSGWMREQAMAVGARQVVAFGLTSNDLIIGTLELYALKQYVISQEDIDLYTALATQIGNVILGQRLLQQSLEAQQFASQLVTTNKSIAEANDYIEMAHAVLNDMPDDIEAVAIALFNRPFTLMGNPGSLRSRAVVTRNGTVDEEFVDPVSAVDDARVTYFLHEYLEGRMMQLWTIARPRTPVLAAQLVEKLQQEDIDVVMSFGLNMSNSLRGLLLLAGRGDLREQSVRTDGMRAIADQLAAVIENRILLQQATDALDLIQSQYETSSRVFGTSGPVDVLRAISDFAGGMFSEAQLVTTEADGVARIIARLDHTGGRLTSEEISMDDYPASQTLNVLEALEVRDVTVDTFLSENERQKLLAADIRSLVLLPILKDYALSGLVMLADPTPNHVSTERLRAMRSLADQVGVVLENRRLMRSKEESLRESQQLYEANRAMLSTRDNMEVLRTLKHQVTTDASVICQVDIEYHDGEPVDLVLVYELTPDMERQTRKYLTPPRNEMLETSRYLQQLKLRGTVSFALRYVPVPGNPVRLVEDRYNIQSYILVVVQHQSRISSLVMLLFDDEHVFEDSTRRLYEAIGDQVQIAIENQKLLSESQQAAREMASQVRILESIGRYAARINTVSDEAELLQMGAQTLVETLDVDHCGVVIFNDDDQTGTVTGEFPLTDLMGTIVSTRSNPVLHPDFNLDNLVFIPDVEAIDAEDGSANASLKADLAGTGIKSVLIMPLVGKDGELIGSVGLDLYQMGRHFTESELNTARTIAAQMAVGLQNIRLLRDSRTRAEQLQRITDFSQTAQTTLNLDEMIGAALSSVPRLIPVSHIAVALYDEAHDELYIAGGWQERNGERQRIPASEPVERSLTTTGYVFETGKYLYIPDMTTTTQAEYPHAADIVTLLAMPLTNRNRTLGVMTIGARHAQAYTDTDIALFQQMVNQMAVAIDNARAYTQSQRVAENKTLANEISVQLQRQNDINKMIDLTMKEVGRAIGANRGRIRLNALRKDHDDSQA